MSDIRSPAVNPCGSCPYRKDVPSGVWAPEEYEKLPKYDGETFTQPFSVFMCHQQDGRLCAGWVATHDMDQCLGIRMNHYRIDDLEAVLDYTTPTPLWASGEEAAAHGMAAVENPDAKAQAVVAKLLRQGKALSADSGEAPEGRSD